MPWQVQDGLLKTTGKSYGRFPAVVRPLFSQNIALFDYRLFLRWVSDNTTSVDVEIHPHRRRLGRSQTDFALQAIVECRAATRKAK